MKQVSVVSNYPFFVISVAIAMLITQSPALAHCDAVDGPIVPVALKALDDGDSEPILRWVTPDREDAVREAFDRARDVRELGGDASDLAELWFLETLIRIHREGEGAAYTGLKPAGSIEPIYMEADAALDRGTVQPLSDKLAAAVREQIEERFQRAVEARAHADHSIEAGRGYVEAYVEYVHLVERLDHLLAHHEDSKASDTMGADHDH